MYSGKTEELISITKSIPLPTSKIVVLHEFDRQRNSSFVSHGGVHGGVCEYAAKLKDSDIWQKMMHSKFVFIDEIQFFPDASEAVLELRKNGVNVFASGLDTDFRALPWEQIQSLMCQGPRVIYKRGMCAKCIIENHDHGYRDSTHSIRLTGQTSEQEKSDRVLIGGADVYAPVCFQCHCELQMSLEASLEFSRKYREYTHGK